MFRSLLLCKLEGTNKCNPFVFPFLRFALVRIYFVNNAYITNIDHTTKAAAIINSGTRNHNGTSERCQ